MKSFKHHCIRFLLLFTVVSAASWLFGSQPNYATRQSLSGMLPMAMKSATVVEQVDPDQEVTMTFGLKLRNVDELEQLLADQGNPASPEYRRYLSPDQFAARFCPTQEEYDKLIAYLKSEGLTVVDTAPNRLVVTVRGKVSVVQKAFGVTMNRYSWKGKQFVSVDRPLMVPAELTNLIESVMGLNDLGQFHPKRTQMNARVADEPSGYGPPEVATVYNFPNANNRKAGTVFSGKGVTIAIASAYSYNPADVEHYWQQYGITRTGKLENIAVGGLTLKEIDETTLDLEQCGAQAPGADILMYLSPDSEDYNFARVFNRIVTDNRADIISFSWGAAEDELENATMKTMHAIFMQANAQGMSIFCASGDFGAYDARNKNKLHELAVDYPSADPYVIAVGGTHLKVDQNGDRVRERAWSGSGGGASTHWTRASWQSAPGMLSGGKRLSADVALFSDPWLGHSFYFQGKWRGLNGGTSYASPNWAALWALGQEACGARVGSAGATIYRIGRSSFRSKVFHDITEGDNGGGRGPGYKAGPGWDHPTGLGVPDGRALVEQLKSEMPKTGT